MSWLQRNSLWIVGLGLMISSSGVDGAYMARWMQDLPGIGGAAFLGYVLNTTSDIANLVLTYWYGRLRMDRSHVKQRMARPLILAEGVAVLYSWFFSWRQLRLVLPRIEGEAMWWVAPISAGFIPLLLAFVGYAQSLLAGRIESDGARGRDDARKEELQELKLKLRGELAKQALGANGSNGNGHDSDAHQRVSRPQQGAELEQSFECDYCGRSGFRSQQAVSAHKQFCEPYQQAQEGGSDG